MDHFIIVGLSRSGAYDNEKNIFCICGFFGLIAHQVRAAESETSYGVGYGALYSGMGVNVGLRSDSDFKYVAVGCPGIGYTDNLGWVFPCGIGAGWIWTGLLSKDDNRNGFGLYIGPVGSVYVGTVNPDALGTDVNGRNFKARYGLGFTYVYFVHGIKANGLNIGFTPTISEVHGDTKGGLLLNVGYQF